MKNRHPLKIEISDKCHYNDLIRRYFTSLLLLTHSSRSQLHVHIHIVGQKRLQTDISREIEKIVAALSMSRLQGRKQIEIPLTEFQYIECYYSMQHFIILAPLIEENNEFERIQIIRGKFGDRRPGMQLKIPLTEIVYMDPTSHSYNQFRINLIQR